MPWQGVDGQTPTIPTVHYGMDLLLPLPKQTIKSAWWFVLFW